MKCLTNILRKAELIRKDNCDIDKNCRRIFTDNEFVELPKNNLNNFVTTIFTISEFYKIVREK